LTGIDEQGLRLECLRIFCAGQQLVSLDVHVSPAKVLTVMGPSGSGKSTLLAVIAGTADPVFRVSGRILLDGIDLQGKSPQERHTGILFQDDILFPHLSVGGNLGFALTASIKGRRARRQKIEAALAQAGLEGFADRDPATLSGGQRARVAVMRLLLSEPHALLLDEPFSKLDTGLRRQFRQFVFKCAADNGLPVLMVTHDIDDALAAGGPVLTPLGEPVTLPLQGVDTDLN